MSLDDETPTQYHGPGAVTFMGPHGKPLSVSQDHFNRLTESGALTDEQMLGAIIDGRSLQQIIDEANQHADFPEGFITGRIKSVRFENVTTGGEPESITAAEIRGYMHDYPRVITIDELNGRDVDPIYNITRERCTKHLHSWHYADHGTCAAFDEELLRVDAFTSLPEDATPNDWRNLAAKIVGERQRQFDDTVAMLARGRDLYAKEAERSRKWEAIFLVLAIAGWGLSLARGIWGF